MDGGEEEVIEKVVTGHLSELRIEGSSPTAVLFSEPCPCCDSKKRRCLHPPSRSRKKVLVFEPHDDSSPSSLIVAYSAPDSFVQPPSDSVPSTPEKSPRCCVNPPLTPPSPSLSSPFALLPSTAVIPSSNGALQFLSTSPAGAGFPSFLQPDSSNPITPLPTTRERNSPGNHSIGGYSGAPPRGHLARSQSDHPNNSLAPTTPEKTASLCAQNEENKGRRGGGAVGVAAEAGGGSGGWKAEQEEVRVRFSCTCGAIHEIVVHS